MAFKKVLQTNRERYGRHLLQNEPAMLVYAYVQLNAFGAVRYSSHGTLLNFLAGIHHFNDYIPYITTTTHLIIRYRTFVSHKI